MARQITAGMMLVRETITGAKKQRVLFMKMGALRGRFNLTENEETKPQDYCLVATTKEEHACLEMEQYQELLAGLSIYSAQETMDYEVAMKQTYEKKGKWLYRIPGFLEVEQVLALEDAFNAAIDEIKQDKQ